MNPLDTHERFEVEFMNPNPTSSKTKDGPKYRVSFELQREAWECFMDANTNGMVLEGVLRVTEAAVAVSKPDRPKGGPYSKEAAFFCQDELAQQFARTCGYPDMEHMIYERCGISSRSELDHDDGAYQRFKTIKQSYAQAML